MVKNLSLFSVFIALCIFCPPFGEYAKINADEPLLAPAPSPSNISIKVELVDNVQTSGNLGSPVANGKHELLIINQAEGKIFSYCTRKKAKHCPTEDRITEIFNPSMSPEGTELGSFQAVINVVGRPNKKVLYVALTSLTLPDNVPVKMLPFPDDPAGGREDFLAIDVFPNSNGGSGPLLDRDIYRIDAPNYSLFGGPIPIANVYQIIYEFRYKNGVLSNPRPIVALQAQDGPFHLGGAMELAPNGKIVYVTGDNIPFGMEGRKAPQLDDNHVGKILIIDPDNGDVVVAAKGVRNVQHLETSSSPSGLAFGDIGGVTAEELNFISWFDLQKTDEVENFGWGRNPDGNAREGTFYVSPGQAFILGTEPAPVSVAPVPEPGFEQPVAQYGRPEFSLFSFVAVTGPVISKKSFNTLTAIIGDLPSGQLFGTSGKLDEKGLELFSLQLVDENLDPLGPNNSLNDLFGDRVDPRFFKFPDGTAGVLLEATGDMYRLTEVD